MLPASLALASLALLLAWPVPLALTGAAWTRTAPATALLLWQAIALAGGLSMIGALLTIGLAPFGETLVSGAVGFVDAMLGRSTRPTAELPFLLALCAAALLGAHLVLNLVVTAVSIERQRRHHRHLVQLLSTPVPDRPHTRMLDLPTPVAYCLPGSRHSLTVFSAGLASLLTPDELRAVLEHERAHLFQRHYLVVLAFDAWHRSLPWFPTASKSHHEVRVLVEMLADDTARKAVDDRTLATAIALVSAPGGTGVAAGPHGEVAPAAGMGLATDAAGVDAVTSSAQAADRVRRLVATSAPLPPVLRGIVAATAVSLVLVPTVLLFAPTVGELVAAG